jgi:hypothetical protein
MIDFAHSLAQQSPRLFRIVCTEAGSVRHSEQSHATRFLDRRRGRLRGGAVDSRSSFQKKSICKGEETAMSSTLINLIIQLVTGVIGGNAAGTALKDYSLGNIGNTIAGAIGGVGGGQLLQSLIPAIAGAAGGDLDLGSIIGQVVGGGAGGAILTIVAGVVKNMMATKQAR